MLWKDDKLKDWDNEGYDEGDMGEFDVEEPMEQHPALSHQPQRLNIDEVVYADLELTRMQMQFNKVLLDITLDCWDVCQRDKRFRRMTDRDRQCWQRCTVLDGKVTQLVTQRTLKQYQSE